MFTTSVVAVVLAGSALGAVVLLDRDGEGRDGGTRNGDAQTGGGQDGGGQDGDGGPDQQGIDQCVIGAWRVVSYVQELALGGTLELVDEDGGPRYTYRADGTGEAEYGDGVQFEDSSLDDPVPVEISGTVSYRFRAADGVLEYPEQDASGARLVVEMLGTPVEEEVSFGSGPYEYRCDGEELRVRDDAQGFDSRLQRE